MKEIELTIRALWQAIVEQDEGEMVRFFTPDAQILWPNTNERFDLMEYLRANCGYPGQWRGKVEQIALDGSYSVVKVWPLEGSASRAVTFYQWRNGKIEQMVEYWGDIGPAPAWRQKLDVGTALEKKDTCLPAADSIGRCGFCCGVCPDYVSGGCAGCNAAHQPGDCFTRDCTKQRGLKFCTLCGDFPCEELLKREKATVLDKSWLRWKGKK